MPTPCLSDSSSVRREAPILVVQKGDLQGGVVGSAVGYSEPWLNGEKGTFARGPRAGDALPRWISSQVVAACRSGCDKRASTCSALSKSTASPPRCTV